MQLSGECCNCVLHKLFSEGLNVHILNMTFTCLALPALAKTLKNMVDFQPRLPKNGENQPSSGIGSPFPVAFTVLPARPQVSVTQPKAVGVAVSAKRLLPTDAPRLACLPSLPRQTTASRPWGEDTPGKHEAAPPCGEAGAPGPARRFLSPACRRQWRRLSGSGAAPPLSPSP